MANPVDILCFLWHCKKIMGNELSEKCSFCGKTLTKCCHHDHLKDCIDDYIRENHIGESDYHKILTKKNNGLSKYWERLEDIKANSVRFKDICKSLI
jgi:hypothetical protein